jgi:glycosyltransferase involved in cell wall biosynthesis
LNLFILVPVYNEGAVFLEWLPKLLEVAERIGARIVVIDDGSEERVKVIIKKEKRGEDEDDLSFAEATEDSGGRLRIKVLRHPVNCGVGAALQTGLDYVKTLDPEFVLTIDGDGQHDPEDLVLLLQELQKTEVDIVNGSRFLKKQEIPFLRRCANMMGNIVNFLLSGYWVTDSQSGMKGFSKTAVHELEFLSPGYEWCIDLFREANWSGFSINEVPISVLYNSYTLNKGQGFSIGIDMIFRLAIRSLIRIGV